jgi:hypothetical protein
MSEKKPKRPSLAPVPNASEVAPSIARPFTNVGAATAELATTIEAVSKQSLNTGGRFIESPQMGEEVMLFFAAEKQRFRRHIFQQLQQ